MLRPSACLLHSFTSGGAGILCVPSGNGGTLCPSTMPAVLCHLCQLSQDGTRMLHVPAGTAGTQHRASCALSPAPSQGWDAPHSHQDCVSGLVCAVCLQSAPEPRAAGPDASPRLEKGERERREPEPGSAARRAAAAAGAGRWQLPSLALGDSTPWGHGDTALPWPGCSPSCSSWL